MSATRRACPKGYILRSKYKRGFTSTVKNQGFVAKRGTKKVRIYPKASSTTVKASCVKDRGLEGKGPGLFGPLRKGELTKHGYNVKRSQLERHNALKRAINEYGALATFHKLDAVSKLSLRTAPEAHKIFKADRHWLYKKYVSK